MINAPSALNACVTFGKISPSVLLPRVATIMREWNAAERNHAVAGASPVAVPSGRYAVLADVADGGIDNDDDDDNADELEVLAETECTSNEELEEGWQNAITESLEFAAALKAAADTPVLSGEVCRGSIFARRIYVSQPLPIQVLKYFIVVAPPLHPSEFEKRRNKTTDALSSTRRSARFWGIVAGVSEVQRGELYDTRVAW